MYFFIFAGIAFLAGIAVNNILRKITTELIEETEHIDTTSDSFFKQMKLRYENYIKIGHAINNTEAFAGKYLEKYKLHGISIHGYEKISAFTAGMSVVCGVCGALIDRTHAMEYLLTGFLAMYIITGTCKMLDVPSKRKRITLNIVDYFENRFYVAAAKEAPPAFGMPSQSLDEEKKAENVTNTVSAEERMLIDEILREYLG